jgi:hypothetical protein
MAEDWVVKTDAADFEIARAEGVRLQHEVLSGDGEGRAATVEFTPLGSDDSVTLDVDDIEAIGPDSSQTASDDDVGSGR